MDFREYHHRKYRVNDEKDRSESRHPLSQTEASKEWCVTPVPLLKLAQHKALQIADSSRMMCNQDLKEGDEKSSRTTSGKLSLRPKVGV